MEKMELKDQRSQMVVKSNDLIQKARYKLSIPQQKFVTFIVSLIRPDDKEFTEYNIRVDDFCKLTGLDKNHVYGEFRQMIDDFDSNKSFWVDTDTELYKFRWFDDTTYHKKEGMISVTLSKRLKKYLLQLTENFTEYELYNILALGNSKYSIRIYELFKSYEFQKEKTFKIEELKELLCAETYEKYKDFRVRVLEPATKEINELTDLNVSFDPIYRGRRIAAIKFTIDRKGLSDRYKSYQKTVEKIEAGRS